MTSQGTTVILSVWIHVQQTGSHPAINTTERHGQPIVRRRPQSLVAVTSQAPARRPADVSSSADTHPRRRTRSQTLQRQL